MTNATLVGVDNATPVGTATNPLQAALPTSGTPTITSVASAGLTVPTNGALTQTVAGALAATTYFVKSTWVNAYGETLPGAETSLAVLINNVLNVAAPSGAPTGATGWNVYVSTTTGTETKQNGATPIALGTSWVEPTTGLIAGVALPLANTAVTSIALLAANQNRKGGSIQNTSTAILYVLAGAGTANITTLHSVQIPANGYYEIPYGFTGAYSGIWASVNGQANMTEYA